MASPGEVMLCCSYGAHMVGRKVAQVHALQSKAVHN